MGYLYPQKWILGRQGYGNKNGINWIFINILNKIEYLLIYLGVVENKMSKTKFQRNGQNFKARFTKGGWDLNKSGSNFWQKDWVFWIIDLIK